MCVGGGDFNRINSDNVICIDLAGILDMEFGNTFVRVRILNF